MASGDDYFLEIEAHFALKRGTPFVLNAKDWALMKKWSDDGVPLPIVIEAIDTVFERNEASGRRKVISSLSYCRHAVKELWDERRELLVGGEESLPEESPAPVLESLAAEIEASAADAARTFAPAVRDLARERSVPKIEERLIEIEHELIEAVLHSLPGAEEQSLREQVTRALGGAKLDEKTRARTEEANLRRVIRERFGLPRLTLFR